MFDRPVLSVPPSFLSSFGVAAVEVLDVSDVTVSEGLGASSAKRGQVFLSLSRWDVALRQP